MVTKQPNHRCLLDPDNDGFHHGRHGCQAQILICNAGFAEEFIRT